MVSTASLIGIIFTLAIATVLPIAALLFIKLKYKASLVAALMGAAGFVSFALLLEQLLHALVIPLVMGNAILFCIYGCLASGVFEETSRLVGFTLLKKARVESTLCNAVMYGVGHGGIEAMMLVGTAYFSNLVLSLGLNTVGFDKLAQEAGANSVGFVNAANQIMAVPSGLFYVAGLERVLAMTLHVGLTLIMWLCVTKRGPFALYPVCILLHACANSGAAMMQTGIITNGLAVYIILGVAIAVVYAMFFKFYKSSVRQTK